ncbi:MAG: cell division protein ZapA [Treponema sp.]|nr:cell division protein ZapA [Treponema sp.]
MGSLTIDLLGTSFKINAHQDTQYLQQLLSYYSEVVKSLQKNFPGQDPLQTAILAGVMISDELYTQKYSTASSNNSQENNEVLSQVAHITAKLIDSINQVL